MSQRPDTHASVAGICANSRNVFSMNGVRDRDVTAPAEGRPFIVVLLTWLLTATKSPGSAFLAIREVQYSGHRFLIVDPLPTDGAQIFGKLRCTRANASTSPGERILVVEDLW